MTQPVVGFQKPLAAAEQLDFEPVERVESS